MEILNSLTSILPQLGEITGRVTYTAGVPALTALTGEGLTDQAQVSVADTATGVATITVQNALANAQVMVGFANATTPGIAVATSLGTYSGNAGSVPFTVFNTNTNVATDDNFTFTIRFY